MKALLFSASGRIARAQFWKGALIILGVGIAVGIVNFVLGSIIGGDKTADGGFSVQGVAAIPFLVLDFGFLVFSVWAGICLGIKRFHDRGKSGAWVLIQFVPLVGPLWYFVEAGCLRGTEGPNLYGADTLRASGYVTPLGAY